MMRLVRELFRKKKDTNSDITPFPQESDIEDPREKLLREKFMTGSPSVVIDGKVILMDWGYDEKIRQYDEQSKKAEQDALKKDSN